MPQHPSEIDFRFKYVNERGKPTGWSAMAGTLTEDNIQLKDNSLSYQSILHSTCRDNSLILTVSPQAIDNPEITKKLIGGNALILQVTKGSATVMESFIDRISSFYLAEHHKKELESKGKGQEFRSVCCPHCDSTVDVSLLNKTPYIYCRFCETIFQEDSDLKTVGRRYRLCDECGWFDRVQGYTEFYFYFLLVIYGFRWKRRHLCDNCVKGVFWKVLLINLIFILGIFPALWMKIKSWKGRDQGLKALSKANALGKKGKTSEADIIYSKLYGHYPDHPGLLLNQSFAHLKAGEVQPAWNLLESALDSCSNYGPAVRTMNKLQDAAAKAPKN